MFVEDLLCLQQSLLLSLGLFFAEADQLVVIKVLSFGVLVVCQSCQLAQKLLNFGFQLDLQLSRLFRALRFRRV